MLRRACVLLPFFAGCASTDGAADGDTDAEVLDVRVADPEPDAAMLDLLAPEILVEPYSERMWCYYGDPLTEDIVVDALETFQGQYGHHIVVLSSKNAKAPGTLEDCTDANQMPDFSPLVLPDTPLPSGFGILLKVGTQPVMQVHYVNPTDNTLRTRDVARLRQVDRSTITTWTSTFATGSIQFELPPGQDKTVTFDCDMPAGVSVLLFGGHMHEWGTKFETLLGTSEDAMTSWYLVDPWVPEFRDAPPVNLYFEEPLVVEDGTRLRTSCSWHNDQSTPIAFPSEMCSTFGYLANRQDPWICEVEE